MHLIRSKHPEAPPFFPVIGPTSGRDASVDAGRYEFGRMRYEITKKAYETMKSSRDDGTTLSDNLRNAYRTVIGDTRVSRFNDFQVDVVLQKHRHARKKRSNKKISGAKISKASFGTIEGMSATLHPSELLDEEKDSFQNAIYQAIIGSPDINKGPTTSFVSVGTVFTTVETTEITKLSAVIKEAVVNKINELLKTKFVRAGKNCSASAISGAGPFGTSAGVVHRDDVATRLDRIDSKIAELMSLVIDKDNKGGERPAFVTRRSRIIDENSYEIEYVFQTSQKQNTTGGMMNPGTTGFVNQNQTHAPFFVPQNPMGYGNNPYVQSVPPPISAAPVQYVPTGYNCFHSTPSGTLTPQCIQQQPPQTTNPQQPVVFNLNVGKNKDQLFSSEDDGRDVVAATKLNAFPEKRIEHESNRTNLPNKKVDLDLGVGFGVPRHTDAASFFESLPRK